MNLKIQAPRKNFQAPWRPGALYLSTPDGDCLGVFVIFLGPSKKILSNSSVILTFDVI
jgi:hypothetical protein